MRDGLPPQVAGLACILCGDLSDDPWRWDCSCSPDARRDVVYVEGSASLLGSTVRGRPFDMWRYREVLPVPLGVAPPPLSTGGSPVYDAPRLAEAIGVGRVAVKDDGRNPSASLKDRPSAVAVFLAREAGSTRVCCASTGNAASSLACQAASVGIPATIFVPKHAPEPKLAQLRVFGAQVFRVDAAYDRTWDLCAEVARTRPWFDRNCAVNPYLVEGKKTVALELAEQLGERMPDWVALSVGDGCTIAGVVKGLEEAVEAGFIPRMPRVLGVQAAGAAPLVRAAETGTDWQPLDAHTLADSISVGTPRNPIKALQAVGRCGGAWVAVEDDAILEAMKTTARCSGVFAEPAAAAVTAGVEVAARRGIVSPWESVAIIVSGNGLKDTASALEAAGPPIDVAPDLDAVEEALGEA